MLSRSSRALIVAATAALSVAWFFHIQIAGGFATLFGDADDAVIGVVLLDHWRAVLAGTQGWNGGAYFHPYPDVLGYNDGMFLLGLLYAGPRALGVDPLLSAELAGMAMRAAGFVFFHLLARRMFGFGFALSLLGATLATISGTAAIQANHAQLFTVLLLPLLALLLWLAFDAAVGATSGSSRRAGRGRAGTGWAAGAALLFGTWLMTAFYTAWFSGFFLLLFGLAAASILAGTRSGRAAIRRDQVWALLPPVLAGLAVGIIAAIPFLAAYLPKAAETGMHSFADVVTYAPPPLSLLDTRLAGGIVEDWPRNPLAAALLEANARPMGFAPLLLLAALAGGLRVTLTRQGPPGLRVVWRSLALATLLSLLLVMWMPAWRLVYFAVPGARGLRDIARFLLVLMLPMTLLALHGLDGLLARLPRWRLPLLAVVVPLLLAEEWARGVPVLLDAGTASRLMRQVAPAPAACRSFYVTGHAPLPGIADPAPLSPIEAIYRQNVDAMLVATLTGVPTINGFSTFNPPDWDFARVEAADYADRVGKYASAHALSPGLCRLDLTTGRWTVRPDLPAPVIPLGVRVELAETAAHASLYTLSGWNVGGAPDHWTTLKRSLLRVVLPADAGHGDLDLHLTLFARLVDRAAPDEVTVLANGHAVGRLDVGATPTDHVVRLPAGVAGPGDAVTIALLQPALHLPGRFHLLPYDRGMVLFIRSIELDAGQGQGSALDPLKAQP